MAVYLTLFDAIREQEELFERDVRECVEGGLRSLGADVYRLEWANALAHADLEFVRAA